MARQAQLIAADLPDYLQALLVPLRAQKIWVGYSGGMDSHVLLHALSQIRMQLPMLVAVHIDHQIQVQSKVWAVHCGQVCAQLQIPMREIMVDGKPQARESPEEAARKRRYAAWEKLLQAGELLLLAQHSQDQAETVLLQLMRGAGPAGLSAMPFQRRLGVGELVRPLLSVAPDVLLKYAKSQQLQWVEDPSNQSLQYDRNFLRHEVMPLLQQRWPHMNHSLQRTATVCAEYDRWLSAHFQRQLVRYMDDAGVLSQEKLQRAPLVTQTQIIRCWVMRHQGRPPQQKHLQHIVQDLLVAKAGRGGKVCFANACVCRYGNGLYWVPFRFAQGNPERQQQWRWDIRQPLTLPKGRLLAHYPDDFPVHELCLEVRFRQGGERCQLLGREHHTSVKHLLQESRVPPWERDWLPIIWIGREIAQIGQLYYGQAMAIWRRKGLVVEWDDATAAS